MVGNNLTEKQLQEIVDKTILYADKDGNGKISFQEFCDVSCLHYVIYLVGHIDIHTSGLFFRWWGIWMCRQRCLLRFDQSPPLPRPQL